MWSGSLWGLRKTVLATNVEESDRAMVSDGTTKALHHQGEFQHQNCTVGTVHDSDHEGVVRIFVRHSYHSNELFTLINYAAQFFLYQECNDDVLATKKQFNIKITCIVQCCTSCNHLIYSSTDASRSTMITL